MSCTAAAAGISIASKISQKFQNFPVALQLANCTKITLSSSKNFGILPYVKSLDKIKNLCYNIYRK
jgi:hypothetical protein